MQLRTVLYSGLVLISFSTTASVLPDRAKIDHMLAKLGSDQQVNVGKGIDWGVVPGPFYTPELEVGLGVAAVGLYRPDQQQHNTPLSSLSLSGFASSSGAFGLGYENFTFLRDDQWRFYLSGDISRRPLYYWGQGYQAGRTQRGKQSYTSSKFSATPELLYRLVDHTYFGLGWSVAWEEATQLQNKKQGSFYQQHVPLSQFNSGIKVLFSYDTRDFIANPSGGQALNLAYTWYDNSLGSDNHFDTVDVQYDLYHALNDTTLLAWEVYSRFSSGNVPWSMQPQLGDSSHLRGYYQGRYRDLNTFSSQLELRKKLSWRHGVVAWAGAGNMSDERSELFDGHWLPSVGVGYRFEFKKRMNVRLDYGLGQHSSGFYFQVGEAF